MAELVRGADWLPLLKDIDAVVNCAGVLQDSPMDSTAGVHAKGARALFEACERLGIRRVVHLSAIGVERATPTSFSKTKLEGDRDLQERDLDWVILRPSVVVGRAAYGGSALFRGLAALPILPEFPRSGALQVVQLDDLVETVLYFLRPQAPTRVVLDIAGPERLRLIEIVTAYRRWLGWKAPAVFKLPQILACFIYRAGDLAGALGWYPPVRSTVEREFQRGAIGDPARWKELTGIEPASLRDALAREPASVQERWFARLYFLKPLIFIVFALFWVITGIVALGPGWEVGMNLLRAGGIPEMAPLAITAGALADIAIGLCIAYRPTARFGLWAALCLSLAYVAIGSILVPGLWADPLGPMLKIWPVLALNLVALAILDDR